MNEVLVAALKDWRSCTSVLTQLREDQIKEMLDHERTHAKRASVLARLHQRYCTLRMQRERAEILAKAEAL